VGKRARGAADPVAGKRLHSIAALDGDGGMKRHAAGTENQQTGYGPEMSKFAKGKSWIEHRLSDDLEIGGQRYQVNLVARKGTGVQGYRVTLDYIRHDGTGSVSADLPNAASTADVHALQRELAADRANLVNLFPQTAP
jgi:hypothetical protein